MASKEKNYNEILKKYLLPEKRIVTYKEDSDSYSIPFGFDLSKYKYSKLEKNVSDIIQIVNPKADDAIIKTSSNGILEIKSIKEDSILDKHVSISHKSHKQLISPIKNLDNTQKINQIKPFEAFCNYLKLDSKEAGKNRLLLYFTKSDPPYRSCFFRNFMIISLVWLFFSFLFYIGFKNILERYYNRPLYQITAAFPPVLLNLILAIPSLALIPTIGVLFLLEIYSLIAS